MNKPISEAKREEIRHMLPALRRAAQQARRIAVETGTHLVIVQGGQVVRVPPERIGELPPVEPDGK